MNSPERSGSPYRSRPRSDLRKLRFFHARFALVSVIAVALFAIAAGCTTTPRAVRLECQPEPGPALRCVSVARSMWGEGLPKRTRIVGAARSPGLFDRWSDPEPRPEHESLDVETQYTRRGKGESDAHIAARYGHTEWTEITDPYPYSSGSDMHAFSRFSTDLRAGKNAKYAYRSGWGNALTSVACLFFATWLVWSASGSSTLIWNRASGSIDIRSKNFWHSRPNERSIGRDDVEDAVVTQAPGVKGGLIYRPGLLLKSGKIEPFGIVGYPTPERAKHWVGQVRKLLDLPAGPVQTKTIELA